ncbi:Scr1 family TA system antitoxin-like transcriptional regulator [Streptomyces sp. HNM0574]|uniref:Scr1 family TA system antitoxin-like transcriptional regulator n=1 Tax=Streptomyces sp. HNM0574 TaxID=2714954 RepID=UPI00146B77DF|nr:Scr1 family TA system antitoxin-like transcriptional regulator [Streptomyces sp. HNM0574]NLU68529.1 helix-turn-helix transcriptional regulator [Streptomyces sp. HNM0574]
MPPRKPQTERRRRLGAELRIMREQAGLTISEAAAMHGTDRTTMTNIEVGRFGVSADRVRVWASNYACRETDYVNALANMAKERGPHWWDEYRDLLNAGVLDLAEMEQYAVALRTSQITHVPGLLQHKAYTKAVFRHAVPALAPDDFERKVNFRMERRRVLDREGRPQFTFLIHEVALHMRFGDSNSTRAQLKHLLEQTDRENVTIRVIPFAAGGFATAGVSTSYAYGPVARLDMAQTDIPTGSLFQHAETPLANYREVHDRMERISLDPEASRKFIHAELTQL